MEARDIIKKYDSMSSHVIGNWLNLWQECADWCYQSNDNINRIRVAGQEKPPQRMIDTCIEANNNFASGFFSHMFPPNTVWARYRHPNPITMQNEEVAYYFEQVSRIAHRILIGSNFAQEEFQALLSMGCFGTNCLTLEEDDKSIIRFKNLVISNIRIDENHLGEVDTVAREYKLNIRQAIQKFGLEALKSANFNDIDAILKNNPNKKYTFIQCVQPRLDYNPKSKKATDKPFASYHVCKETNSIVLESGFDYNPYKVSRFVVGNEEIYGRSPMSMVLGTARRTNVVYRSLMVSAEQHSNPQWLIPDDDSVSGMSNRAGSFIRWRATNPNGKPERLAPNGNPQLANEMYKQHDDQIKRMFYNHLFRPLDQYRNMTATEVNERMTTDLMTLAPFVSRYIEEHVTPLMEHVYYIIAKKKLLPPLPEILRNDPQYEIDYVGRLSMATKAFETMGAIQTLRMFGEVSQLDPRMLQSLDNVDKDKFFREIWYANSSSMNALKDPSIVRDEREQQAAAMAAQQEIQQAPAMADAIQKLSGGVDENSILNNELGE